MSKQLDGSGYSRAHEYVLFDNVSCEEVARGAFDECMAAWRKSRARPYSHLVVRPAEAFNMTLEQRRVRLLRDRMATNAPEMLAALQMAVPALEWCEKQWASSPQHGDGINVLAVVRAAIAKAEGE